MKADDSAEGQQALAKLLEEDVWETSTENTRVITTDETTTKEYKNEAATNETTTTESKDATGTTTKKSKDATAIDETATLVIVDEYVTINGERFMAVRDYRFYYDKNRLRENDICKAAGKHQEEHLGNLM